MRTVYTIMANGFTAGLSIHKGVVTMVTPRLRFLDGCKEETVKRICEILNWRIL